MKTSEAVTNPSTFTSAVPVLPTTNMDQAIAFYEQLGFQVIHQQADYALVTREAVELHIWLCSERSLTENSGCRIFVTGIEALYQEFQAKGLLDAKAAVTHKPWGTKEFVVFSPDCVLITFVERVA
jgi:hypothetical protein